MIALLLARILGAELYGQFVLLKSTAQVLETALGIAFGIAISRHVTNVTNINETNNIVISNILVSMMLSLIIVVLFYVFSEEIHNFVFENEENILLFKLSLIYIFFSNSLQISLGVLKGEQRFKAIFFIYFVLSIINLSVTILSTYIYSITGAMVSFVSFSVLQFSVFTYCCFKTSHIATKLSLKKFNFNFSSIKKFSLPLLISGFSAPLALWVINVFISRAEDGFIELSYFNAAFQIFAIVIFMPLAISDALFPMLNSNLNNPDLFKKVVRNGLLSVLFISLFVSAPIFYFSEAIMSLYGSDYIMGARSLELLLVASVLSSLLSFLGKVLISYGRTSTNLFFNFMWAFLVTITAYLLISEYNASVAVSLAFVFSYLILFCLQSMVIWKALVSN